MIRRTRRRQLRVVGEFGHRLGRLLRREGGVVALTLDVDHNNGAGPQFAEQDLPTQRSSSRAAWSGAMAETQHGS